jgi:hypothetical protein
MPAINIKNIDNVSTEIPHIPAGVYHVRISAVDTNKKVTIKETELDQVQFRFKIIEGDNEGRVILHGMAIPDDVLEAKNKEVWEMLARQWKKFAIATGLNPNTMESADFFGVELYVQVGQRTVPNKDGGEAKTYDVVKEFLSQPA